MIHVCKESCFRNRKWLHQNVGGKKWRHHNRVVFETYPTTPSSVSYV